MYTPQWRQLSVVCMHWLRKNSNVCETADPHTSGSKDPAAPRIHVPAQCRLECGIQCMRALVHSRKRMFVARLVDALCPCVSARNRHLALHAITVHTFAHVVVEDGSVLRAVHNGNRRPSRPAFLPKVRCTWPAIAARGPRARPIADRGARFLLRPLRAISLVLFRDHRRVARPV